MGGNVAYTIPTRRDILAGRAQLAPPSFYFYLTTWQLRDYGKLFTTAMMMTYRKILTKKVIAAGNVRCGFVLMLAPRARELHREAQGRG